MRAMKDSGVAWVGEIPESWKMERIKFHAEFNPATMIPEYEENDDVSFIPMDHLKSGYHLTSMSEYRKVKSGYVVFQDGDILMAKVTPCLENGNLAIASELKDSVGFGSTEINVIRCRDVFNQFLYYLLQCPTYIQRATYDMFGVAGLKRLTPSFIPNSFVTVPERNDQEKIAKYLNQKCSEIDALIAAKEKSNALLKERRQSIIYETVTKGLNPDVPMKDSGIAWIGSIPETWRVAPLKRFATIRSGLTLGKKYPDGTKLVEYPYLRVANVQGEYTDLTDIATVSVTESEAELYALHAGELLMTEGGDRDKLGRGCVWEGQISPCLHQNHVFALTTNEELNIYYVDYLTTSDVGRNYFDFTAKKTTNLASTNATTILAFPIPIPCRKEQDAIVSYLREKCAEIDSIISANETIIAKLKEYRQSVIYEAVTGKIEV